MNKEKIANHLEAARRHATAALNLGATTAEMLPFLDTVRAHLPPPDSEEQEKGS